MVHSKGRRGTEGGRKNRWSGPLLLVTIAVIVLFTPAVLIGAPVLSSYDKSHLEPMECTVTSARAAADRFGYNGVVFETSDCGKLGLSAGVTEANSAEIAAQIVVGARYTFEIGAGTRSMKGFFQSINITPTVYSFTKI